MFRRLTMLVITMTTAAFLLASCGSQPEEAASTPNKAEIDSVLSESSLPGSSAVKGALAASDSAQARADRAAAAAGN